VATAAIFGISQFASSLKAISVMLVLIIPISFLPIFTDATNTLEQRFTIASGSEGNAEQSFMLRNIGPITGALEASSSSNGWLGKGMGYGSNAASTLLTGTQTFLAGEDEYGRVFIEFGPIMGISFMLFRWILELTILFKAFIRLRDHEPLAWLLAPLTLLVLPGSLMEQTTTQGFMVISVAFSLAALRLTGIPTVPAPLLSAPILRRHPRWEPRV
jgi:hypothetical protein